MVCHDDATGRISPRRCGIQANVQKHLFPIATKTPLAILSVATRDTTPHGIYQKTVHTLRVQSSCLNTVHGRSSSNVQSIRRAARTSTRAALCGLAVLSEQLQKLREISAVFGVPARRNRLADPPLYATPTAHCAPSLLQEGRETTAAGRFSHCVRGAPFIFPTSQLRQT